MAGITIPHSLGTSLHFLPSPNYLSSKTFEPLSICNYPRSPSKKIYSFALEMTQTAGNHSPEIKKPNPKIPKLQQNDDSEAPHETTPFNASKGSRKSFSPSRASPLSAAGRSGLAWEHSIDVGGDLLDADKNPVFVILYNHSDVDFEVKVGDGIAQMVIKLNATPEVRKIHQ